MSTDEKAVSASTSIAPASSKAKIMALLNRLSAMTSTLTGLDGALMLAQYSTPVIIALLLRLSKLKKTGLPSPRLLRLVQGLASAGGGIGDARTVMRAFGLLPIIQWLLALHPNPLLSLRSLFFSPLKSLSSPKAFGTTQALALAIYYPLEHAGWLASKGVLGLSPEKTGKAVLWSVRAWAVYVMLDIYKLQHQYLSLQHRTRVMRESAKPQIPVSQAEGYELGPIVSSTSTPTSTSGDIEDTNAAGKEVGIGAGANEKVVALKKEWRGWQLASLKNLGYGPLTVHWGAGPVWTSPVITGVLGCISASAKLAEEWDRQG